MGADKLRLRLPGGQRLADLPAQALARTCSRLIAVRRPDSEPLDLDGFQDLVDVAPGGGPLAGVVAAVLAAETPWLLILGGDMPWVAPEFLRSFMAFAEQHPERAVMISARQLQPMPLALPVTLGAEVIQRFRDGERALRRAIAPSHLRLADPLPLLEGRRLEPWLSVNTPPEWERLARAEAAAAGAA